MSAPRQEQTILTPSQVGQYIKGFMDRDRVLSGLLVRGELSNYKMYPSGHHYFTLKDGEGALRCVMFRGDAASLRFHPQNGMQVIAAGRVTVFPRDGQYQLYCVRLTPEGAGDLAVAFEQMKARLLQEYGICSGSWGPGGPWLRSGSFRCGSRGRGRRRKSPPPSGGPTCTRRPT